jgi:hypothetical protein
VSTDAKKPKPKKKRTVAGVLRPDELYTLDEASARLGVGACWMRSARQNGLAVLYSGGRGFVAGSALIAHLQAVGTAQKDGRVDKTRPVSHATGEADRGHQPS